MGLELGEQGPMAWEAVTLREVMVLGLGEQESVVTRLASCCGAEGSAGSEVVASLKSMAPREAGLQASTATAGVWEDLEVEEVAPLPLQESQKYMSNMSRVLPNSCQLGQSFWDKIAHFSASEKLNNR